MEDEVLVSGDSTIGRLLKWLSGFTRRAVFRKDLSGIYFDEQCIVASDGFGVAAIPTPDTMKEHAGKLLEPRIPSWKTWRVMWPVIAAKFPNIRNALPKTDDKPVLKTVFDARLLAAAIQGFQRKAASERVVRMSFYPIKAHEPHPNGSLDCLLVIQSQQA